MAFSVGEGIFPDLRKTLQWLWKLVVGGYFDFGQATLL